MRPAKKVDVVQIRCRNASTSAVVLRPPGEPDERRTLTAAGALSSPSIAWPEDVASRSRSFAQVRGSSMSTVTAGHGHHAHTGMLAWERLGSRWTQTLVQTRGTVFAGHVEASCVAPAGPSGHGIAQAARSMTICAAHAKSRRRSPCALLPRYLEAGLCRFVRNSSYPHCRITCHIMCHIMYKSLITLRYVRSPLCVT